MLDIPQVRYFLILLGNLSWDFKGDEIKTLKIKYLSEKVG